MLERAKEKNESVETQVKCFDFEISNVLRGVMDMEERFPVVVAAAYALYLVAQDDEKNDIPDLKTFLAEKELEPQLRSFITDRIGKSWDGCRRLIKAYERDVLAKYILDSKPSGRFSSWQDTPDSISKLAIKLLDINHGNSVADICCGAGGFMKTFMDRNMPDCDFTGLEISAELTCLAKIRSAVLGRNADIAQCNTFDTGTKYKKKFDRVFCAPPFAVSAENIHCLSGAGGEMRAAFFPPSFPSVRRNTSWEWIWLLKGLEMLKPGGRLAIIMPLGRLFSTGLEQRFRRFLVENRLVETVVALPGGLYNYTSIPVGLLILSEGNSSVRLIDADDLCIKKRGGNIMTDEHVERIVNAMPDDGICMALFSDDIAKNDYSLAPATYFTQIPEVPHSVPLSEVVVSIGRGTALLRNEEEEVPDDTPVRMVTVSDIIDGRISDELKPISGDKETYAKYIIEDGDVLISKVPSPSKVAVAEVPEETTLVASVNLYVLKVDRGKCDPYYLQAYLCSKLGQAQISSVLKGTVLLSIAAKDLASIPFPMLPLEQQKALADKFRDRLRFAHVTRMQAEKTLKEAFDSFDAFLKEEA